MLVRSSVLGLGLAALVTGSAGAQTPPPSGPAPKPAPKSDEPAPPPPAATDDTGPRPPPPPAPSPNWAPPPQETPPREKQGAPSPQEPSREAANAAEAAEGPPTPTPQARPTAAAAEKPPEDSSTFEVYGFVMFDGGYDFGKIGDPNWFDVERPTKLPAFKNEFGRHGRTFMGVRQTRFGVRSKIPTKHGDVESQFEWELFGVGVDAGQTTFRLRHAYGDWKWLRVGQTWSPFMDIDVFPNSIEYWGPNGMAFFRNVQVAWMPIRGESRVTVALERPGASADTSNITDRIDLTNVVPRFPAPDLSAEGRYGGSWGYVELAGIVRYLRWDDLDPARPQLGGHAWGWGFNLSSNIKAGDKVLFKGSALYGRAIENYMNDAPADIGPEATGNPVEPLEGEPLPVLGLVAFADIEWCKLLTSSVGWSFVWIDNSSDQGGEAFHIGHYALGNLLVHPSDNWMLGGEFQFGRRENNDGVFDANDFRIQFSAKYEFAKKFGGK